MVGSSALRCERSRKEKDYKHLTDTFHSPSEGESVLYTLSSFLRKSSLELRSLCPDTKRKDTANQ